MWDNTERPNLQSISIEVGEEFLAKDITNAFNKIIIENFPNLEKKLIIQMQEALRTQYTQYNKRNF